jgi:hypothetical protein
MAKILGNFLLETLAIFLKTDVMILLSIDESSGENIDKNLACS